jgi:hypothetical protein
MAFVIAVSLSTEAAAWGARGHGTVEEIAFDRLTPAVREQVEALIGSGKGSFVAAATWADTISAEDPENTPSSTALSKVLDPQKARPSCRMPSGVTSVTATLAAARRDAGSHRARQCTARQSSLKVSTVAAPWSCLGRAYSISVGIARSATSVALTMAAHGRARFENRLSCP